MKFCNTISKKIIFLLCAAIIVLTSLCACEYDSDVYGSELTTALKTDSDVSDGTINAASNNAAVVMDALDVRDRHEVDNIIYTLDIIGTGNIKSATLSTENANKVLNIVSENGVKYRIYLTKNLTVEAVKNLDNGEWVIESER